MQKWILVFALLFFPMAAFAAALQTPKLAKCGDGLYNSETQGCCGGDVYELAAQGCCGGQKIYTQGSQKCCPKGVVCQGNQRCLPPGEWSSGSQCEDDPNADNDGASGALKIIPKTLAVKEKKTGKLYFSVEPNPNHIVSISAQPRPDFLQLLSKVWSRIKD